MVVMIDLITVSQHLLHFNLHRYQIEYVRPIFPYQESFGTNSTASSTHHRSLPPNVPHHHHLHLTFLPPSSSRVPATKLSMKGYFPQLHMPPTTAVCEAPPQPDKSDTSTASSTICQYTLHEKCGYSSAKASPFPPPPRSSNKS
ncbi:hypothetical protein U1Q18_024698 [Sarracenia purpurea var. burkii]